MENTGFKFESRIFYFIDLQNEEDYLNSILTPNTSNK